MSNLVPLDYSDYDPGKDILSWDTDTLTQSQIQQPHVQQYAYPLRSPQSVIEDGPLDKPALQNNRKNLNRLLINRPSINQLVQQGIMPDATRVSPAHADRLRKLQRAQTSDKLRTKIQQRPARSSLVDQHILEHENPQVSPLVVERQKALKKSLLHDRLNSHLDCRPGTLELVEKGVLPLDLRAITLINDGSIPYIRVAEVFDQGQLEQKIAKSNVQHALPLFRWQQAHSMQHDGGVFLSDSFATPPASVKSVASVCSIAPSPSGCFPREFISRRLRIASNSARPKKTTVSSNSYNVAGSGKQVEKFGNLVFHNFIPPSEATTTAAASFTTTTTTTAAAAAAAARLQSTANNSFSSLSQVSLESPSSDAGAVFQHPYFVSAPLSAALVVSGAGQVGFDVTQTPTKVRECQQAEYLILQESRDIRSQLMSELTDEIRQRGSSVVSSPPPPLYAQVQKVNGSQCGQPAASPVSYERFTVPQLKAECRELGLLRYHKLTKKELLRLLEPHRDRALSLPASPEASASASTATSPTHFFQPNSSFSSCAAPAPAAPAPAPVGAATVTNIRNMAGQSVLLTINPSLPTVVGQSVEQVQHLNITAEQLQTLLHQLQLQEDEKQWRSKLLQLEELKQRLKEAERQVLDFLPNLSQHYSSVCPSNFSSEVLQQKFQELARCADDLRNQLSSCYEEDKCRLEKDFHDALFQSNGRAMQTLRERHDELDALLLHSNESAALRERQRSRTEPNDCHFEPKTSSFSTSTTTTNCSSSLQRSWTWSQPFHFDDTITRTDALKTESTTDTLNLIDEILADDDTHLVSSPMQMDMDLDVDSAPTPINVKEATAFNPFQAVNHFLSPDDLHEMLHLGMHPPMTNYFTNMELMTPCSQDMFGDMANNVFSLMDTESDSIFAE